LVIDDVEIDLALTGHGWADCHFRVGDSSFKMTGVSYCTDALGDLVRAATLMATGHNLASISFDGEPREWRWMLHRHWLDDHKRPQQGLRIRILGFEDIYRHAPEAEGQLEFDAVCDPDDFARAVERVADRIWNDLGETGYAQVWGTELFPKRGLLALKAALASPPEATVFLD
jgi:hypothetical protein